ncbi:hypothetical protein TTHERM_00125330 (macronuclear) [Tetrahymena thermophila SB210]|uniref:Uncharacterized protein n=1 Tax=Tetrahymena thermophila (strain SB210) TaxID=312017 RepID=I7M7T6_TETTS|nr:hypothetical protein TTHERM_00125330 [Tetrahymena thermophila SB210]EAR95967.2 hypothetical protein TTHERM_00125330 [Tetrahymena thermophila SB210]|eukprot:XP_001016212.2 hypothetical protein TTHERM_00125330 [Tetrahymena thermophila SB210]
MLQMVYCYQYVPIPQYSQNKSLESSQNQDPISVQGIPDAGKNSAQSDQYNMNNQNNEVYDHKSTCHPINDYRTYFQNPTQQKEVNLYNPRMMYCMPQYMQYYTNQNLNYPQQCYQIIQTGSQQYQIGLNSQNNSNYQNSFTNEIRNQPTQYTGQQIPPQEQQSHDKQKSPSIFSHEDNAKTILNKQIKIDQNRENSNYFINKNIIAFHENIASKQMELLNSARIDEDYEIEQDNKYEFTQDRSIIKKNVIQQTKKEEEQASLNIQQPINQGVFKLFKKPQIQSSSISENSISSFDKINILNSQNEKNLNSIIFPEQNWQKEDIKQEFYYLQSNDEFQKNNKEGDIKKKITFKQNFSPQKVELIQKEKVNKNQLKANQQNIQANNFRLTPDQLQIKNQNCAIIKNEDYEKYSDQQCKTYNLDERFDELEHFLPNLSKHEIQNEKIVDKISKNIKKSKSELSVSVKQSAQRKLNSKKVIQNSKQKIEKIHKIHQQAQAKNEASQQQIQENKLTATKQKLAKKYDQPQDSSKKLKFKNINEQWQKEQQQLMFPAKFQSKQSKINELNLSKAPIDICNQNPLSIKINQNHSCDHVLEQQNDDLKYSEPNQNNICDFQNSNQLIDGSYLNQVNNILSQQKKEKQIQKSEQELQKSQDSEQNEYLIKDYLKIQKSNSGDDDNDQAKRTRIIFSKNLLNNSNNDNSSAIKGLRVLKEDIDQCEFQLSSDIPNQTIQFQCKQQKNCENQQNQDNKNSMISKENLQIKNLIIDANQKEHQQESISENPIEIEIEDLDSQVDDDQIFQDNQHQQSSQEDEDNQMSKVAIGNASKNILKAFQKYISNHEKFSQCTISSLNRMYQRNTLSNLLLIKIYLNQRYKKLMNEFIESYAQDWLIQSKVQNLEIHLKILEELKNNNVSILKTKKKKYQRKKITEFNNHAKRKNSQQSNKTATINEN